MSGVVAALGLGVTGCDWAKPKVPGTDERSAQRKLATARRLKRACGSAETYDRLKALTFDEVSKVRGGGSANLDAVFANATIRMEQPVAKSRDEQLDITVCQGRLVLDLPPGLRDAFNGQHQLAADVEYSAQQAADGSGLVYAMKGAEPIIYRLAALTLRGDGIAAAARPAPAPAPAPAPPAIAPTPTRVATASAPPEIHAQPAPPSARTEVIAARAAPPPPRPPQPPVERRVDRTPPEATTRAMAQPSFNCARVTSQVLHRVCADPDLAALDRRMSAAFYGALAAADEPTRDRLRASRTRFLAFRIHCPTASCVAQAYEDRIAEIGDIAAR